MSILYPRFTRHELRVLGSSALLGSLIAGTYGIVHDQITYSISEEYFTKLKFEQFAYANFDLPNRVFVAIIGFLATFWVGLFVGWFLGRLLCQEKDPQYVRRQVKIGFAITLTSTMVFGLGGYGYGLWRGPNANFGDWIWAAKSLGVTDTYSFIQVAYIHNAGYMGGLVGLILVLIRIKSCRSKPKEERPSSSSIS